MNFYKYIIFILFFLSGYSQDKKSFEIKLKETDFILASNNINSDLISIDKHIPKLRQYIVENYKGIKQYDSVQFFYNSQNQVQFFLNLSKRGLFEEEKVLSFLQKRKMKTSNYSSTPLIQDVVFAIFFNKGELFCIGDFNRNEDFSDEVVFGFENDQSTYFDYTIYDPIDKEVLSYKRKVRLNYVTEYMNVFFLDEAFSKSYFKLDFLDAWQVMLNNKYKTYNFYIQSNDIRNAEAYIFSKDEKITNDKVHNYQFVKNIKDTLKIKNNEFLIDSINLNKNRIDLNFLKTQNLYGRSKGDLIHNFKLNAIDKEENEFFIYDVLKKNKKTILYFWGTWCEYCIINTEKLKEIYSNNDIEIIGVAVERHKENAIDYLIKNNINWLNTFSYRGSLDKIVQDLEIKSYPTYILIDADSKILFVGSNINWLKKEVEK